ncbi:uncharacterized protein HemY [Pseudomonas lini]|jgi:uncharacterized protein HemY|uniref:hypothetical protein n=1 Tax=Pseudomonas lini TaxID=163011 RepID=UPI002788AEF1|nr:hypothetical protein [Pseudomonas lini]MDQ0121208.1 uncharacterized protein HemY [Pseudomonas lini]
MNRWQRLWWVVKLLAALAVGLYAAVQASRYMLESPDAAQIHPLSILVVGLIFGFATFVLLSLLGWIARLFLPFPDPVNPRAEVKPQTTPEEGAPPVPESPPTLSADDPDQQKDH